MPLSWRSERGTQCEAGEGCQDLVMLLENGKTSLQRPAPPHPQASCICGRNSSLAA